MRRLCHARRFTRSRGGEDRRYVRAARSIRARANAIRRGRLCLYARYRGRGGAGIVEDHGREAKRQGLRELPAMAGWHAARTENVDPGVFGFKSRIALGPRRNPGADTGASGAVSRGRRGPSLAAIQPPAGRNGTLQRERHARPLIDAAPNPSAAIVRLESVSRAFGGVAALDRVDLEVDRGEIFGIIG